MTVRNLAVNGIGNVEVREVALGSEPGDLDAAVYRIWGEEPEQRRYRFSTVDLEMQARPRLLRSSRRNSREGEQVVIFTKPLGQKASVNVPPFTRG
jgi:hypothetical protein